MNSARQLGSQQKHSQKRERRNPTPVAALGMEDRIYRSLEMFFRSTCNNNFILVKEELAAISIIDMDGYKAELALQQHRSKYPHRPIILTSINEINDDDDFYIKKPIKVAVLEITLHAAEKKARESNVAVSTSTATALATQSTTKTVTKTVTKTAAKKKSKQLDPPILENQVVVDAAWNITLKPKLKIAQTDSNQWSSRSLDSLVKASESGLHLLPEEYKKDAITTRLLRQLQYNPENMLQGYFKKAYDMALASRCNVRLEGPWRPITICIKQHKVVVDSNFRHIFALSAMTFEASDVSITLLRKDEDDVIVEAGVSQSIEQFFWKLSLRTSRGKVPIGTDLNIPVLLNQWPNFTRTTITPHALRIAALWTKQPTSLLKTAEILNISLSFVFAFYSSALPLNLLSQLKDNGRLKSKKESIKKHTYRKLFHSLLNKLKNKNSADIS